MQRNRQNGKNVETLNWNRLKIWNFLRLGKKYGTLNG